MVELFFCIFFFFTEMYARLHRAQLFKANDVVSKRFVINYIEWYANMLKIFAEKMWVAFAVQKLLTFFQQKISEYRILNPLNS